MSAKEVFIVEDNEDIRDLISYVLIDDQYQVQLFPTATAFSTIISDHLPDLIILDIMLPDGNGVDLCRKLKNDERTTDIPIFLMSANLGKSEIDKDVCAEEFISKPFDIDVFKSKVDEYVLI